jgi:hypothetical protein
MYVRFERVPGVKKAVLEEGVDGFRWGVTIAHEKADVVQGIQYKVDVV